MQKTLNIANEENRRIKIIIHLNNLRLSVEEKQQSLEVIEVYNEDHIIDIDTDLDVLIYDFYKRFLEVKDVEYFWTDQLKEQKIVEFNFDLEED